MKNIAQHFLVSLFYLGLVISFQACKVESESFTAKAWHNMNARYNSYFISRETMKQVEKELFDNRRDNYNRILDVLPPIDTNDLRTYDPKMEDIIKKSANIKNRHENSQWLDPSYILIGKARFYLRDYENAISTFKYVNTRGDEDKWRNRALIELLYTYIETKDFRAARAALLALRKRRLEKEEMLDYLLTRGHFFREQNNYLETAKSLGSAIQIMPRGEYKARTYFILGQIYQKYGKDAIAYKNYKKVLQNNPPYELEFNAQLYQAQVSGLKNEKDVKRIKRYFKKLLADTKNKEYQDKIYYEMGLFALRQDQVPKAIGHLNQSIIVSTSNPTQKAYSYLQLGEIYYGKLQDYELAKTYYDSTIANLPENVENYRQIKKRQETLTEFVEQLNIYRTEDSLQKMARMEEPRRGDFIKYMLDWQETKRQNELDSLERIEQQRAALKQQAQPTGTLASTSNQGGGWYFDNATAVRQGIETFRKEWGDIRSRPPVDNWRRSAAIRGAKVPDSLLQVIDNYNPALERRKLIDKRVEERTKEIYAALPKDKEDFVASDKKIEEALYELGKIYRFKLEEPENTVKYLELMMKKFPKSEFIPEALYLLHLTAQDLNSPIEASRYKQKLITQYPNSSYAKRLTDPDWLKKAQAAQAEVDSAYQETYELYRYREYEEALTKIEETLTIYPDNLIEDRFVFLRHLIQVKMDEDKESFANRLKEFIQKYPESELVEYARDLLNQVTGA